MEKTNDSIDTINFKTSSIFKNNRLIVEGTDFFLKQGAWTALMGKSGVGKTLFLKSLCYLKDNISYVSQNDRLIPWLTLGQNISLSSMLSIKNVSKNSVAELLEMIELQDRHDAYPHQISYGMQTRVLLARALYQCADIFLLDEIFNGLDDETKENVCASIRHILSGKTVLLVTHSESDAQRMTSSIYKLAGSPAVLNYTRYTGKSI